MNYRNDYDALRRADRIADHLESLTSEMEHVWMDDWVSVEKTEFCTMLIQTQDDEGNIRTFEVAVNEREVDVQQLDSDDVAETVDPDLLRDLLQDR